MKMLTKSKHGKTQGAARADLVTVFLRVRKLTGVLIVRTKEGPDAVVKSVDALMDIVGE